MIVSKTFPASSLTLMLVYVFLFSIFNTSAQYNLNNLTSSLHIYGTSTQHDWSAAANKIDGKLNASYENNVLKSISSLEIKIDTWQLKSGKSKLDENMYKELQAKKYPQIVYTNLSANIEGNTIYLTGKLNVAGIEKTIKTTVYYSNSQGVKIISGSFNINMSEFGIDPPELFFGALKTGDSINIKFTLKFN